MNPAGTSTRTADAVSTSKHRAVASTSSSQVTEVASLGWLREQDAYMQRFGEFAILISKLNYKNEAPSF